MRYAPEVFDQPDLESQRRIILGPDAGLTTDQRWVQETAYLKEKLIFSKGPIIDYGCGVGRLTQYFKHLGVLGVDQSTYMLDRAQLIDKQFNGCTPGELFVTVKNDNRKYNGAFAIWVLQHCPQPERDISLIAACLNSGSFFYVVNRGRFIPIFNENQYLWGDDKQDIIPMLEQHFILTEHEPMPPHLCAPGATFQKWVKR